MDETLKTVIVLLIGWALGIVSTFFNSWLQTKRERERMQVEREEEIRKRLVGDQIQISEVMIYIKSCA